MRRQRTGSVVCPSCGRLVGVRDERCLSCGLRNPGLYGFAGALRRLGGERTLPMLLMAGCGVLYLVSLLLTPDLLGGRALATLLAPGQGPLFLLGASGAVPVFGLGRWWTVLSAAWLHGNLLHIGFNLLWVRDLAPGVARLYGAGRMLVIWTAGSVVGFAASSTAGLLFRGVPVLGGAGFTLGASASIFGLLGALIAYGQVSGQSAMRRVVWGWVVAGAVFGFVVPGIDNWAHAGGFAGGWVAARALDPLAAERPAHLLAGLACLAAASGS
ncbi:MAG: rhomboid family intramembrane serine protease, partial [Thermoanaerobaculia bacterium]